MAFYAQSSDVARLAMDIEDAGWAFYRKLAEVAEDKKTKELFLYLADQEVHHKIMFDAIAKETEQNQEDEYVIDVIARMQTDINDLKTFVFPKHAAPSKHIDITLALDIAVHAEEESIRIYSEVQKTFIDRFSRVLQKIIEEEKKHRTILLDIQKRPHE